jgi:hypothetical protein
LFRLTVLLRAARLDVAVLNPRRLNGESELQREFAAVVAS